MGFAAGAVVLAAIVPAPPARATGAVRCHVAASAVRFGRYNPFSPVDARSAGQVVYACTAPTPITIAFDWGRGRSYQKRQMSNGVATLTYNLFLDPAATMVWGDGSGGSQVYRAFAARRNAEVAVPVYGRIVARQTAAPLGAYGDTLLVTIMF